MTKVIAPTGVSAHYVTLAAFVTAIGSAFVFTRGTPLAWLVGALLLELWYVLDHVDGQVARWNRTASLDGTTLDYLMHHAVNLIIPQSIALGLAATSGRTIWCGVGLCWSCGLVVLNVRHDARYKAFIQRLKILEGKLIAVGGGGGRPKVSSWPRFEWRSIAAWCCQKVCEIHVLTHLLTAIAVVRLLFPNVESAIGQWSVALLTVPAVLLPAILVGRSLMRGEGEAEFAAWYQVPTEATLEFRDGRYVIEPATIETKPAAAGEPQFEVVRTS